MNEQIQKTFSIHVFGRHFVSLSSRRLWQKVVPEAKAKPLKTLYDETIIADKKEEPLFVINSMMLYDCFKLLTRTRDEDLHAVTGSVIGNIRSLERIVPLSLSTQSVVGAAADDDSIASEFIRLNEYGLRPLAYFHSHPGYGANITRPSGVDRRTQSIMERSGGDIIGGIFSRDAIVRFYANQFTPNVKVIGRRVRRIKKNVYKLEIEENL